MAATGNLEGVQWGDNSYGSGNQNLVAETAIGEH